jgi:predicted site-specific integrase-resolvase
MKVARIYLRVSTDEQDLARQAAIEHTTRAAGYYIAGVYREKASGARADRPELLRMIADLQLGEVVVAEKIDRISRLPLAEAERLVDSIRAKGAKLAVPGLVDLSEFAVGAEGVARVVVESVQELLLSWRCKWPVMTMRRDASGNARGCSSRRPPASMPAARPT